MSLLHFQLQVEDIFLLLPLSHFFLELSADLKVKPFSKEDFSYCYFNNCVILPLPPLDANKRDNNSLLSINNVRQNNPEKESAVA